MTAHEEVYLVVETFGRVPNSLRRTKASGVRAKKKKNTRVRCGEQAWGDPKLWIITYDTLIWWTKKYGELPCPGHLARTSQGLKGT